MIHRKSYDEVLDGIIAVDSRYHRDAYHFVREGLDYTQESISKQGEGTVRHISGQELLAGMRSEHQPHASQALRCLHQVLKELENNKLVTARRQLEEAASDRVSTPD